MFTGRAICALLKLFKWIILYILEDTDIWEAEERDSELQKIPEENISSYAALTLEISQHTSFSWEIKNY